MQLIDIYFFIVGHKLDFDKEKSIFNQNLIFDKKNGELTIGLGVLGRLLRNRQMGFGN